jgi:hypothetical protein
MSEFFLSEAELMARTFGVVLGAASCSENVTNARLDATAEKMKTTLSLVAVSNREAEAAQQRFSAAVVAGRRAVQSGEIADWAAENALREIEDDLEDASPMLD